jgi:hypothetical protein
MKRCTPQRPMTEEVSIMQEQLAPNGPLDLERLFSTYEEVEVGPDGTVGPVATDQSTALAWTERSIKTTRTWY